MVTGLAAKISILALGRHQQVLQEICDNPLRILVALAKRAVLDTLKNPYA